MTDIAAHIILDTTLDTLAAKNGLSVDAVRENLIAGHAGLRAQFDKLVELGRRVAIVTACDVESAL